MLRFRECSSELKANVMKTPRIYSFLTAATIGSSLLLFELSAAAQYSATTPTTLTPETPEPVQLSYGVGDILKMARAKVGDEVIVAFIRKSGRRYNMSADEIVYLRKEGVSDLVLTTMLDEQQRTAPDARQNTQPAAVEAVPASDSSTASPQYLPESSPATAVVETAPASTVYVIPDSTTYYYSSYSSPFYSAWPYWYSYPFFTLGFYWGDCDDHNDCNWNNNNYCYNGNAPPPPPPGGATTTDTSSTEASDESQSDPRSIRSTGNVRHADYTASSTRSSSAPQSASPTHTWSSGGSQLAARTGASTKSPTVAAQSPQYERAQGRFSTTSTWAQNGRQNSTSTAANDGSAARGFAPQSVGSQNVAKQIGVWNHGSSSAQRSNIRTTQPQVTNFRPSVTQSSSMRSSVPTYASSRSSMSSVSSYGAGRSPSSSFRSGGSFSGSTSRGGPGHSRH